MQSSHHIVKPVPKVTPCGVPPVLPAPKAVAETRPGLVMEEVVHCVGISIVELVDDVLVPL